MAYKNQYNEYVKQMLDGMDDYSKGIVGLDEHPHTAKASEASIRNFTDWADPWNPIFNDDEYAKNARYGGIIATPMYQDAITTAVYFPQLPAEGGFMYHNFAGEDWWNLHEVHFDDTFTVMHYAADWEDITIDGEDTVNEFLFHFNVADAINQDGKVVASVDSMMDVAVIGERLNAVAASLPYEDHYYTDKEWDYINRIIDEEEIRGANPRYWEDVQTMEDVPPCTIGPTTRWDMVAFCAARQELAFHPMRVWRQNPNMMLMRDEFNVTHMDVEWHICNKQAAIMGDPRSFNYGGSGRTQMARLVTNWMGDDGELRGFKWRHLKRTYMGECLIVKGRVVAKRITEDGEYVVDLDVWMDNPVRGNISESALATVVLPVRDPDNPDLNSLCFDVSKERTLPLGTKVRIKDRTDLFPTGYPLANAEGEICIVYPWQRTAANSYGNYICVDIQKCGTVLGTGTKLFVKEENVDVIA